MLKEEIRELKKKLDESILKNADYNEIYKISVQLDKLIVQFYEEEIEREKG